MSAHTNTFTVDDVAYDVTIEVDGDVTGDDWEKFERALVANLRDGWRKGSFYGGDLIAACIVFRWETNAVRPIVDGDEPHDIACEAMLGECVCKVIDNSLDRAELARTLGEHKGHNVVVSDDVMDDESEPIVWCNTCNVTVWYVDSDMAAE